MNKRMRESLSAMVDGEANELELERVLSQVAHDDALRQSWSRLNLAQQAVKGDHLLHASWDISEQVQSALQSSGAAPLAARGAGLRQKLLRPLSSFAVAASVAATVVLGGQQLAQLSSEGRHSAEPAFVAGASPVGMLNRVGATAVPARYGTPGMPVLQPATGTAYDELAQQRLRKYMQIHAEQAALNVPQGLMPFARIPEIRR